MIPGDLICSFTVHGEPVPWARPRRRGRRWFTEPKVAAAKDVIRLVAGKMTMAPAGTAVEVRLHFFFARQRHRLGPHAQRPDLDNLVKLVLDALNGVAWADDGQVSHVIASKSRIAVTEPQTIVEVRYA